jgi:hypothetical protein
VSPRKPPEPEQPPALPPGGGSIPARIGGQLRRRAQAFAEATSRPRGKPWDGATYGKGTPPTDEQRKARAKAIRDAEAKRARDDAKQ